MKKQTRNRFIFLFICLFIIGFFIGYDYSVLSSKEPEFTPPAESAKNKIHEVKNIPGENENKEYPGSGY